MWPVSISNPVYIFAGCACNCTWCANHMYMCLHLCNCTSIPVLLCINGATTEFEPFSQVLFVCGAIGRWSTLQLLISLQTSIQALTFFYVKACLHLNKPEFEPLGQVLFVCGAIDRWSPLQETFLHHDSGPVLPPPGFRRSS